MSIRNKMFLNGSIPGAFCVTFWYLAVVEGNTPDGRWLFVLGAMSATVAITLGRSAWHVHSQRVLEEQNAYLVRKLRELERELASVREDVDSRLTVQAWRDAGFRAASRRDSRLFVVGGEDQIGDLWPGSVQ